MANQYVDNANIVIQPQTGSDRSMFATFGFPTPSWVSSYEYEWQYTTDQGVWFKAQDKVTKTTNPYTDVYSAPSNATQICLHVKYNSKKHKVKRRNVSYFTSGWHPWVYYVFGTPYTPSTPPTPDVSIDGFTLTAQVNTYDVNNHAIEFEVVSNDETVFTTGRGSVVTSHAAFSCSIEAGNTYKVRARALRIGEDGSVLETSAWSEYSSSNGTIPSTPVSIKSYAVKTAVSVQLDWDKIPNASKYEVEYTTQIEYFDSSNETQSQNFGDVDHGIITGLDTGVTWYFRLRAGNDKGTSGWSEILPVVMGRVPSAPTTWSETSAVTVGSPVRLYWVHNSQDGSSQTYAELELTINGKKSTIEIQNSTDEETRDRTSSYEIDTSDPTYTEGTTIYWRVRTKGVIDEYGAWSTQRIVKVYAPPVISFASGGALPAKVTKFPLNLSLRAAPDSQQAVSWNIQIISKNTYETIGINGEDAWILAGESVFSQVYAANGNTLTLTISAGDLYLANGEEYTFRAIVSMDSGLAAELTKDFSVDWAASDYFLDAEIGIDDDTISAYIRPFANDLEGNPVTNLIFSVYRREYDGRFVNVASNIDGAGNITVTDPHPTLDAARYRLVAVSKDTGVIDFADLPEYPVEESCIVLQWDEKWRSYGDVEYAEEDSNRPTWAGSMLKLPYNIDIQDKFSPDVTFANYIGRAHPVSYYGTQLGSTSSWTTEIVADDTDTIYALRRLAIYQGDVYVREPSGSGYWAHVGVSFGIKHLAVTIPVTLDITRVDGGV